MSTVTVEVALVPLFCAKCSILFALNTRYQEKRREDHATFYCPNGHENYYPAKSEKELLADKLARETHLREQAEARAREERDRKEQAQRRLSATQGVVTRQKRKIAAGQCPCCSHQFKNLALHMRRQHPKWNPEKEAEVLSDAR